MSEANLKLEAHELRRLVPLNSWTARNIERLLGRLSAETHPAGTVLFEPGQRLDERIYVLEGTVALRVGKTEIEAIVGGSDASRIALAHQNPRKVTAITKTPVRLVRIQPEQLRSQVGPPQVPAGYEVHDVSEADDWPGDWMSALLRSPIFLRLPPAHLQSLLRIIRAVPVFAGEVICRQDQPGEYFYIVSRGECRLSRQPRPGARAIQLATLKPWDSFGEAALISGQPQAETVTMETDGELLQLDKTSFLELICAPLIQRLKPEAAIERIAGGATWLDVRSSDEFARCHPRGPCLNLPFFSLRTMIPGLERRRTHICVCETGDLSAAAAFILLKSRIPALVLDGGVASLPETEQIHAVGGPAHFATAGLELADGGAIPLSGLDGAAGRSPERQESPTAATPLSADHKARFLQRLDQLQALWPNRSLDAEPGAVLPSGITDTVGGQNELSARLGELRADFLELWSTTQRAERQIEGLHEYIADLKVLTEQFLREGQESFGEECTALRAELDIVREHAEAEVGMLLERLNQAEAENARLRERSPAAVTGVSTPPDRSPALRARRLDWLLTSAMLAGSLLLLGLFGLDAGRALVQRCFE